MDTQITDTQTALTAQQALCDGSGPVTSISGTYYLHADHLGRPQFATDSDGSVVWDMGDGVTPFGEGVNLAGAFAQKLMFPGQYADAETGAEITLSHNWHRTYDPTLGRYLQADPIGLAGGLNRYAYVGGNPVDWIDPSGLGACYIHYDGYPIQAPNGKTYALGHAGALSWDNSSGSTRYYEYGRYQSDFGNVERRRIPDLTMGETTNSWFGLVTTTKPTAASFSDLLSHLSTNWGKGKNISMKCDYDADHIKVNEYAERFKNDPNRPPYDWRPFKTNHCKSFAKKAVKAGK